MPVGTVKSYDIRKGAGLISRDDGGADVTVHVSAVERAGLSHLMAGDRLRFRTTNSPARSQSFATDLALI